MEKDLKKEVVFVDRASWQKGDCINNSAEHTCTRPATLEAVCGTARVRCCIDHDCMERARAIAAVADIRGGSF